jgi:hypothetical protein
MLNDFMHWANTSQRGSRRVYHTGFLCNDRERKGEDRDELSLLADMALALCEDRKVHLFQRRVAPGCFEYCAEKR